ncbi:Glu/Leu/Phe/Val dehydrogenase dimerization domain-containing protein [Actinokineospora cianjurensis]|uniref:Glu/Leu/Phe/Val dehydrogenase dimerization domain-containing protein n=1 Tax=Actinokineospora cianjurensis TaxID=585224 RepID=UPI00147724CF|nr:Glu/Leu/Phe/Val dehydrogenase dimerization domain-containing protein [Actinokineospora cianjurensis]
MRCSTSGRDGGCRLKHYPDLDAAIADVLRLSRARTAKCAAAGLPFGGGKSVIALPPGTRLDPDLRRAAILDHADLIADFDGGYRAGPDIGTGPADMLEFPHAFRAPESAGGSGSSSEPTAIGVRAALRAATGSVAGKRVVLIGLGSVGAYLAESLVRDGAEVTATDIDAGNACWQQDWARGGSPRSRR